jgi:acyl-[acyl-carrier-protein]-phospholipid O-acyltransferase/long-chain-fatty-acid--[acyl-carrier-protein] ligase
MPRPCADPCSTAGVNPLSIPAEVRRVEAIPKLGSGKTDFGAVKRLASEQV